MRVGNRGGFVEVLITLLIVAMGVLAISTAITSAMGMRRKSTAREVSLKLASDILSEYMNKPFADLRQLGADIAVGTPATVVSVTDFTSGPVATVHVRVAAPILDASGNPTGETVILQGYRYNDW